MLCIRARLQSGRLGQQRSGLQPLRFFRLRIVCRQAPLQIPVRRGHNVAGGLAQPAWELKLRHSSWKPPHSCGGRSALALRKEPRLCFSPEGDGTICSPARECRETEKREFQIPLGMAQTPRATSIPQFESMPLQQGVTRSSSALIAALIWVGPGTDRVSWSGRETPLDIQAH